MRVPVPGITSWTEIQLRHICKQFEKRGSAFAPSRRTTRSGMKLALSLRPRRGGTRVAHMTSELDLVGPLSAWLMGLEFSNSHIRSFKDNIMHCLGIEMPRIAPGNATSQNFLNLLCSAHRASSREDVVLALEESGLIIFAPPSTKAGDLVCQFPDSDVPALVGLNRKSGDNSYSIARAVNFLAAPPTATAALCGKAERFCDSDEERGIILNLRPPEIVMLCKSSETPNGKHNIPTEGVGDGRV